MALRGISTSDWHFGGMTNIFDDPTPHILAEVRKPYDYALQNGIKHVFVPGDVSDKATLPEATVMDLIHLLMVFDGRIDTHYLIGNHDVEDKFTTSLDFMHFLVKSGLFQSFKIYKKRALKVIGGVDVCLLPWPNEEVASKTGKPPLVFAHVETPGALGDNGLPLKTKNEHIKRVAGDYVISGHIHAYQHLPKKRWIYNGNPFQKNFGESGPKGWIEFKAFYNKEGRLVVNHDHIDGKPFFRLETVHIKSVEDFDSLVADPMIKYKLVIDRQSGIVLPPSLNQRVPNIVMVNGTSSINTVATEVLKSQVSEVKSFTAKTGLLEFLKTAGLSKPERDVARDMVNEALKKLQVNVTE